jgi:putative DNA primase/helicase
MGALLNALSGAMAALPFVRLTETPRARMDDFAKWVTAAKKKLG